MVVHRRCFFSTSTTCSCTEATKKCQAGWQATADVKCIFRRGAAWCCYIRLPTHRPPDVPEECPSLVNLDGNCGVLQRLCIYPAGERLKRDDMQIINSRGSARRLTLIDVERRIERWLDLLLVARLPHVQSRLDISQESQDCERRVLRL